MAMNELIDLLVKEPKEPRDQSNLPPNSWSYVERINPPKH